MRKRPFDRCMRRTLPARVRAEILGRQGGRCADCTTHLIVGQLIYGHRPPLALRDPDEDPNDPNGVVAICTVCDQRKTPRDLREIARTKRLATAHQEFVAGQAGKVPGRPIPTRKQRQELARELAVLILRPGRI
jgi:5-methylcytosine-specific restriction endonuclease McrA